MAATYEPIATTTLGSAASSITFSSIPGTYTDLRLVVVSSGFASASTGAAIGLVFNSDTGSLGSTTRLYGDGSTVTSTRATANNASCRLLIHTSTSNPSLFTWDVFSYAGSTNKTSLGTASTDYNGSGLASTAVGLWRNTSAITAVEIRPTISFNSGTVATLYGILKN